MVDLAPKRPRESAGGASSIGGRLLGTDLIGPTPDGVGTTLVLNQDAQVAASSPELHYRDRQSSKEYGDRLSIADRFNIANGRRAAAGRHLRRRCIA